MVGRTQSEVGTWSPRAGERAGRGMPQGKDSHEKWWGERNPKSAYGRPALAGPQNSESELGWRPLKFRNPWLWRWLWRWLGGSLWVTIVVRLSVCYVC